MRSGGQRYCHACHAPAPATTRVGHGRVESCSLDASVRTAPRTSRRTTHRPPARPRDRCQEWPQKTQGNYCTICCTIPDMGGQLAGSLAISSTQRDDLRADQQWDSLRILAKSAQVSDRKTVAPRSRCLRKCLSYVYLASAVRWPRG